MVDNVIPISAAKRRNRARHKSGKVENSVIVPASSPHLPPSACVPVTNGHLPPSTAALTKNRPRTRLSKHGGISRTSAGTKPAERAQTVSHYYSEDNMPQASLCRNLEGGMAVTLGRLREDTQYDYKFVGLSQHPAAPPAERSSGELSAPKDLSIESLKPLPASSEHNFRRTASNLLVMRKHCFVGFPCPTKFCSNPFKTGFRGDHNNIIIPLKPSARKVGYWVKTQS